MFLYHYLLLILFPVVSIVLFHELRGIKTTAFFKISFVLAKLVLVLLSL